MAGLRLQPQGRAAVSGDWRSLGLESFTLFQASDFEAAGPSGLVRSGTGHALKTNQQGVGVSQNGGNNTWQTSPNGRTIGSGSQFAVMLAFQLNATGQASRYLVIDGAGAGQSALIYGYVANTIEFFAQGFTGTDPRTGSGIVVNDTLPHVVIYSYDGVTFRGFLDGVEKFAIARTFSISSTGNQIGFIGGATATSSVSNATMLAHARFSRGLPREAARLLSSNPWQPLRAPQRQVLSQAIAPQDASGALSSNLDGAVLSASGAAIVAGSLASTLDNVAMSAAGSVGNTPSGTLASTLAGCSMAATGSVNIPGAFASTLGQLTMTASGSVAQPAAGTFASTLGGVAMSAGGYVGIPPVITGVIVRRRQRPRVYQRTGS